MIKIVHLSTCVSSVLLPRQAHGTKEFTPRDLMIGGGSLCIESAISSQPESLFGV